MTDQTPHPDTSDAKLMLPAIRFLAHVHCLCGADLSAPTEQRVEGDTSRQVARYQGHCVCGRVYFVSVVNTHGDGR